MHRCRVWSTSNFAIRSQRNRTQPLSGAGNLIRFSEDQTQSWSAYSATPNGYHASILAPDGTLHMNQFTPGAANKGMYQPFSANNASRFSAGETFTLSAWLASTTGITSGGFAYYDGNDGTPVTFTLTTTPTRYSAQITLTTSPGASFAFSNVTVMGVTSTVPILWWGYQLERGSVLTQYQKKS